jgi:Uncharacterised nucleotidyltransferase
MGQVARKPFSTEHNLLLACCRWPVAPDAVRAAATPDIDWDTFIDLLDRHGVVSLAGNAIWKSGVNLPDENRLALQISVERQVRHSLHMTRETARWAQMFSNAGIACRFFKGPTLAKLAYADFGLKRSADIDALVPRAQASQARDMLNCAGFEILKPHGLDARFVDRYLHWAKEIAFAHADGTIFELHVRLSPNERLMRQVTAESDCQSVSIGSVSVPTFSDRRLYPYLCYHGAHHGWSRLKWLADLNAFLESRDIAALHRQAVDQGLSNESIVALSLCRDLLGREYPASQKQSIVARVQYRAALAGVRNSHGGGDISPFSRLGIALMITSATIGASLRSALGSIAALWMQPHVRAQYSDETAWIFHILRIPRFLTALPVKRRAALFGPDAGDPGTKRTKG